MRISNPEIIELRDILAESLMLNEMDDAVLKLGQNRQRITLEVSVNSIFREVIIYYNNRSRVADLLAVARSINSTDPALYLFEQRFQHAAQLPEGIAGKEGLEALIRPHLASFNAREWLQNAAAAENCVCLIGQDDQPLGTGFLVGPETVMTNYHVAQRFIEGGADPARLTFKFDFMLLADVKSSGVIFRAAPDWLIDSSPLHPSDDPQHHPDTPSNPRTPVDVPADQLDYAVLRVAGRPGEQPVGGDTAPDSQAKPRGHLSIPNGTHDFATHKSLIIFHHAQGNPLQISIDTDSFAGLNQSGTRVFHHTNTERGSSGSPCFDLKWNLVALHQGSAFINGQLNNRAAPMKAIRALLAERNKLAAISA